MKKIYLLAGWACCFFVFANDASAQVAAPGNAHGVAVVKPTAAVTGITITGDTCVGGTLTANINNITLKELKWSAGSTLVEARSIWQQNGARVAGDTVAGFGASQLEEPYGVAVDSKKRLYVVDDGTQRVQRWDPGAKKGVTVAGGNGKGTALNQLFTPIDVIVDNDFNVYVSDDVGARVVKWAPGATQGVIVAGGNGEGAALNQLNGPEGLCLDNAGNLYIADRWNDRVMKWAPGATKGVVVAGGNGRGPAANQLDEPFGVAVDADGNVFVTDPFNYRVQKWAPGATTGATVAGGNGPGNFARQFTYPSSISVDASGNLYVLDRYRVLRWANGADYGVTVAGGTQAPARNDLSGFSTSWGMCALNDGSVYVSAIFDGRVLKFVQGPFSKNTITTVLPGNYTAVGTNFSGTAFSANYKVTPIPPKPTSVKGKVNVIPGQTYSYVVTDSIPVRSYSWEIPADATLVSGQGTNTVQITWGTSGDLLKVSAVNDCGISPQRWFRVIIAPTPSVVLDAAVATGRNPLSVYPNPATSVASVAFTAKKQAKYELTVTDMMGKVIHHQTGNTAPGANKIDIDVSKLQKNVYLIALKYDDSSAGITKFNKQ